MTDTSTAAKFIHTRSFDVPVHVMFEMWSVPQHHTKWVAPVGSDVEYIRADIREGSSSFYRMSSQGGEMFGRLQYVKITKPTQMVYKQQVVDANENLTRHPMAPLWPDTLLVTIDMTAEGPDRTKVTITWQPYGSCSNEDLDAFAKALGGITQRWTGSLDKLEEYLKTDPLRVMSPEKQVR